MNISRVLICCLFLVPFAATAAEAPEGNLEGLELVQESRTGHLYSNPDADWSAYKRINLEAASIAFRKHWQRDQNRYYPHKVRDRDVQKIKDDLAGLFDEVFVEELTGNGGYEIVKETGRDVMVIKPAITELDIAAPDIIHNTRTSSFTREAGEMTLNIEIFDSVTGDLLQQAKDKKRVPYRHWFQRTTSVTNRADARRLLNGWAKDLRERLDEARAASTG